MRNVLFSGNLNSTFNCSRPMQIRALIPGRPEFEESLAVRRKREPFAIFDKSF